MRVTVPRRYIRLGIFLAFLCLTPAISSPAFAIPKPWEDKEDNGPAPPKGDGDGTVVKASGVSAEAYSTTGRIGTRTSVTSRVQSVLQMLRLGYGWRWYR
jgi:hypothetical protein